jgi:hypothetical protein
LTKVPVVRKDGGDLSYDQRRIVLLNTDHVAEAKKIVEADMGRSTWGPLCQPLKPCEQPSCRRGACRGLRRAKANVQRAENRRYAARIQHG